MKIAVLSSHTPSLFWFRADMMLAFKKIGCEVVAVGNEPEEIWKNNPHPNWKAHYYRDTPEGKKEFGLE